MSWDCQACSLTVDFDNDPCPQCGKENPAVSLHAGVERSLKITRRKKFQVRRGVGRDPLASGATYDPEQTKLATIAIALTKAEARALSDAGQLPAPKDVTFLRLWLKKKAPEAKVTTFFATSDPREDEFPQQVDDPEALTHDAAYLFVYGSGDTPSFEGLEVIDLSEESDSGCAPEVGLGTGRARTNLPVVHAPFGVIHAYLVDPEGDVLEDTPLEWSLNGAPAPADLELPARSDSDGLVSALDLPLGKYAVQPQPEEPQHDGFRAAAMPWLREAPEQPHLQRVKWVTKPVHELDLPEPTGHVHAALVDPWGRRVKDETVAWFRDGEAVSEVEGVALPEATDAEGVLKVSGLPLGTWTVKPAMNPERHGGYLETELPWLRDEIEQPHLQRVKVATPPSYEDDDEVPEERYFELSLREDPEHPFPADARLVLEGGGLRTVQPLGEDAPREGELLALPFELVRPRQRYALRYERDEGDPQTLFSDMDLSELLAISEAPTARLVARLGEGEVSAGRIVGAGGFEQALKQGYGGYGVDLGGLSKGDYALVLEEAAGGAARLALRWSGSELTLLDPETGAGLVRLRGGSPGSWGDTFYLLHAPQARREGLFVACTADVTEGEGKYFYNLAKELQELYRAKGYRVRDEDLVEGSSWDVVIDKLNAAAQAGAPYERLVTIGHGGWDGPIMGDHAQSSQWIGGSQYQRLVEAVQRGVSPTGKIFTSNCHTGGSDRFERREDWSWTDAQPARDRFHAAQDALEQAQADLAAASEGEREAAQQALSEAQFELESARSDLGYQIDLHSKRWTEELARTTKRFAAGPMGITSTTYTMQAVQAILEGEGVAKQETWAADPRAGEAIHVQPGQTFAQGKRYPFDALPAGIDSEDERLRWETLPVWSPIQEEGW